MTCFNYRIFLNGACTPVGCILLQILKIWGAELTTSCYKRSVPVAKALGATDLIVLAETDAVTEQVGNVIIKELKLKNSFDAIINTLDCNLNSKDFQEFCLDRHAIICTLPKEFNSDNYMFVTSILFGCYVYTKSLVQVCIFYMFKFLNCNFLKLEVVWLGNRKLWRNTYVP